MTATSRSDDLAIETLPFVSIVIPAFNEEKYLGRCLASTIAQDYPQDRLETIVVDNGSTDATVSIAREHGVRLEIEPEPRVGGVRNHGAGVARGEILAFLDADCVAPPHWVSAGVEELANNSATLAVGGNYLVEDSANWIEKAWAIRPVTERRSVRYLAAGNMILARGDFEALNGFDESLHAGEDEDFCTRLRRQGRDIVKIPRCSVVHLGNPSRLSEILSRELWLGSSQIESAESRFDRMVMAVHVFAISLVLLPVLLVLGPSDIPLWIAPLLALVGLPAVAALMRKTPATGLAGRTIRLVQLWAFYFTYFIGRTAGLAVNYKRLITKRDTRIRRSK